MSSNLDSIPSRDHAALPLATFQQVRGTALSAARVEKAIIDYYRAFEQRSRWAREDLLVGDEVGKYERKLIDEWERYRLAVTLGGHPKPATDGHLKTGHR
jgi:hypothetical protein